MTGLTGAPVLADRQRETLAFVVALAVVALTAPLAAIWGTRALAAILGMAIVVAIAARPVIGVGLCLLVGPLVVGVARGDLGSVLRPNEALILVAAAGTALNVAWTIVVRRGWPLPTLRPLDLAMLLLTLTGAVAPVLLRYGRGLELVADDLLYALVFVKYLVLYAVVRISVRSAADIALMLRLVLVAGTIVGALSILQVNGLLGVAEFLHAYYDNPYAADNGPVTNRGTSTIASSFGTGDMMAMCLALSIAWIAARGRPSPMLVAIACLFLAACISAGSFSGIIGGVVAALAVGLVTGRLVRFAILLLPAGMAAAVVLWPVVAGRLAGFDSRFGVPSSWVGRLQNLERFVWPELAGGLNWLLGVRPAARIAARDMWRIARLDRGPAGIAAAGGLAGTATIFVLMALDPHLTVRGTADLYFPLLALALARTSATPARGTATSR